MCNIYISFLYLLTKYLFLLIHDRDVQLNDYEIHIEFITFMYVYDLLVPICIGMYRFIQYSVTHLKALISIGKLPSSERCLTIIQLKSDKMKCLLNKQYVNKVILSGKNLSLKCCQSLELLTHFLNSIDLSMLKIWGL